MVSNLSAGHGRPTPSTELGSAPTPTGEVRSLPGAQEARQRLSHRRRVACWLLYATALVCMVVGLKYLSSDTIMPYHERFLGMAHAELPPNVGRLMLNMMHVAGVSFLSVAVGLALMVRYAFERGERWAWWAVLLMELPLLGTVAWYSVTLGTDAPWWAAVLVFLLVAAALALVWSERYISPAGRGSPPA